jgi:hypothetical protein
MADWIFGVVEPSLRFCAHDLQVLTANRPGNRDYHPTIVDHFETGVVFQVFRHMLMIPDLRDYEVRWEMDIAGQYVDLWLRNLGGGEAHLLECGDFTPQKVHEDIAKMSALAPKGFHWFLALFRGDTETGRTDPASRIQASFDRKGGGLDPAVVEFSPDYCRSVSMAGPNGRTDVVGFALLKGL